MEDTRRHIELEVVESTDGFVAFKIKEQTHRGDAFSCHGSAFMSSNEYVLDSCSSPAVEEYCDRLFVRGSNTEADNTVLSASLEFFEKIQAAVAEYNEKNGNHLWPHEGHVYYYIDSDGCIMEGISGGDREWDIRRNNFGNIFRTIEEAKAALQRVKKALKGIDENKLLREALEEGIEMYGPWNAPGDAGGWISKARKALEVGNE